MFTLSREALVTVQVPIEPKGVTDGNYLRVVFTPSDQNSEARLMTWQERLSWLARGYRVGILAEIECPIDGAYRSWLADELNEYPCPACSRPCRAIIFTRDAVTNRADLSWERVNAPLRPQTRTWIFMTPDVLVKPPKLRKPVSDRFRRAYKRAEQYDGRSWIHGEAAAGT